MVFIVLFHALHLYKYLATLAFLRVLNEELHSWVCALVVVWIRTPGESPWRLDLCEFWKPLGAWIRGTLLSKNNVSLFPFFCRELGLLDIAFYFSGPFLVMGFAFFREEFSAFS